MPTKVELDTARKQVEWLIQNHPEHLGTVNARTIYEVLDSYERMASSVPGKPETTGHDWYSIGDGYLEAIWRLQRCLAIMRSNLRGPDSHAEMQLHRTWVAWHAFTATRKGYTDPKKYELVLRLKKHAKKLTKKRTRRT